MKTPVELNEELVKEAFRLTNFKTEKESIAQAILDKALVQPLSWHLQTIKIRRIHL